MNLQQLRQQIQGEWAANARLRMGLMGIAGILCLYVLLLGGDLSQSWRDESAALQSELATIQPLSREKVWLERAEDSRQQLTALRSMIWSDSDLGVVEANLQDWLRGTATKAGLTIRDLNISRSSADKAVTGQGNPQAISVRLVLDYNRLPLLAFLAELARKEPLVMVDRLVLRLASQPMQAEIDVRVLASTVQSPAAMASGVAQ